MARRPATRVRTLERAVDPLVLNLALVIGLLVLVLIVIPR
jgi:hypothetical protein